MATKPFLSDFLQPSVLELIGQGFGAGGGGGGAFRTSGEAGDRLEADPVVVLSLNTPSWKLAWNFQTSNTVSQTFTAAFTNNSITMNASGVINIFVSGSGFNSPAGYNDGLPHKFELINNNSAYTFLLDDVQVGFFDAFGWGTASIQKLFNNTNLNSPFLGQIWDFTIEKNGVLAHSLALDEDFNSTLEAVDTIGGVNLKWLTNKPSVPA